MQWGLAASSSGFRKGPLPATLTCLTRPALLGEVPPKADWGTGRGFTLAPKVLDTVIENGKFTQHSYLTLVLSKADRVPVLENGRASRENIHQTTKSTMNYSGLLEVYKGLQEVA